MAKRQKWISFMLVLIFTLGALLPAAPSLTQAAEGDTTPEPKPVTVDTKYLYFAAEGEPEQSVQVTGPANGTYIIEPDKRLVLDGNVTEVVETPDTTPGGEGGTTPTADAAEQKKYKLTLDADGKAILEVTLASDEGLSDNDYLSIDLKKEATATATDDTTVAATIYAYYATTIAKEIKLESNQATLKRGNNIKLAEGMILKAADETKKVTHKALTWASSDSTVAKVDEEGVVTAVSAGNATITVTANAPYAGSDHAQATFTVTVTDDTPVTVDKEKLYFKSINTPQTVTISGPVNAMYDVTYSTQLSCSGLTPDNKIVMDATGKANLEVTLANVTGLNADNEMTITISIKKADGTSTEIAKIYAYYATEGPKELSFEPSELSLPKGYADADNADAKLVDMLKWPDVDAGEILAHKAVTWESSNPNCVQVDKSGKIKALTAGEVTITVKSDIVNSETNKYATASILIKVSPTVIDTIGTDVNTVSVAKDSEQTVITTLRPAATKAVQISVDHPEYVNVKQNGIAIDFDNQPVVQYDANGQAVLKISLKDPDNIPPEWEDKDVIATITIGGVGCEPATVYVRYRSEEKYINSIILDKKKLVLKVGEKYLVEPVLKPSDATDFSMEWEVIKLKTNAQGSLVLDEDGNWIEDGPGTGIVTVTDGMLQAIAPGKAKVIVRAKKPYETDSAGQPVYAEAKMLVDVYSDIPVGDGVIGIVEKTITSPDRPIEGLPVASSIGNNGTLVVSGINRTFRLTLQGASAAGLSTNEEMVWSSSKKSVATVSQKDPNPPTDNPDAMLSNGVCMLNVLAAGEAEIKVKGQSSGQTISFTLKVEKVPATDLTIYYNNVEADPSMTVAKGREVALEARFLPANATDTKITWKSSNSSVVSVNNKGVITVKKDKGSAEITASLKTTEVVNGETKEIVLTDSVTINACPAGAIDSDTTTTTKELTVNSATLNDAGNVIAGGAVITTTENGGKIEFNNTTSPNSPLTFEIGETYYFKVKAPETALTSAGQIKWIASKSGFISISQKSMGNNEYLLTVKASTNMSKVKSNEVVRLIASNVGTYGLNSAQIAVSDYLNYPEILIQLHAPGPESITITNIPDVLSMDRSAKLDVKAKPSKCNDNVKWEIVELKNSKNNTTTTADIAQYVEIDENTGELTLKKVHPDYDIVVVKATAIERPKDGGDFATATAEINMGYKISSVKLNATKINLGYYDVGGVPTSESFQLQVSAQPYNVLLDQKYITYKSQDPYIAQVSDTGVVTIYNPGSAKEKEYTYIEVQVAGQKTLKCKVTVAKPSDLPDLKKVKITGKPLAVTITANGKGKKMGYTVSGLTAEEKKNIVIEWSYVEETIDGVDIDSEDIVYVDSLGTVSVKPDATYYQAKIIAKFYYVYRGTRYEIPADPNVSMTVPVEVVYTINIKPTLMVDIAGGINYVAKPDTITLGKDDEIPITFNMTPPTGEIAYKITGNKAVVCTQDGTDKNKYTLKIDAAKLTSKARTETITFKDTNTGAYIKIKVKVPAK